MQTKRLVVLSHGFGTDYIFSQYNFDILYATKYDKHPILKEGDVVLFEGGTDINTLLYDQVPNSYASRPNLARDAFEMEVFRQAISKKIPMIGICRGSQFLCAMSGGSLIQHVEGHGVNHYVTDYNGDEYIVTSTHHQMMYPNNTKHRLIAWANKQATRYIGEHDKEIEMEVDPEIVWFEDTKCLAIQGHPEYNLQTNFADHCRKYFETFIEGV